MQADHAVDRDAINPELERRLLQDELGPYTIVDYNALPEDGPRFQLLRGWMVREPAPYEIHQRVVGNLYLFLRRWVDRHRLGRVYVSPFDTVLSEHDVVQPDIVFIAAANASRITPQNLQGAPDLAVEVLSAGTRARDRRVKVTLYRQAGVPEAWIIDPEARTVEVHLLARQAVRTFRGEHLIRSDVLGELDFDVNSLFA